MDLSRGLPLRASLREEYDVGVHTRKGADPRKAMMLPPGHPIPPRAALRGVNVYVDKNGERHVVPRLTQACFSDMQFLVSKTFPEVLALILSNACPRGSEAWRNYVATRTVRRIPPRDSMPALYEVTKDYEPVVAPPRELREFSDSVRVGKVRKYSLAQVFSDISVQDKFELPVKLVRDMQLMAMEKPADAAATLREAMQLKFPDLIIKVVAGDYAFSKAQAIRAIHEMAAGATVFSAAIHSTVTGDKIHMHELEAPDFGWTVIGPISNAKVVAAVYKLALNIGLHEVAFLFAIELGRLGIDIYDGKEYVASQLEGHAGDPDVELPQYTDPETWSLLDTAFRVRYPDYVCNVSPVWYGDVFASTAVQVTPGVCLLNDHVLRKGAVTLDGKVASGLFPVSQDLWGHARDAECTGWKFRDPVVGERAALMFHNGVSVELSRWFFIDKVDGLNIFSRRDGEVVPGMSGAALVALSDFALLGFHSGATARHDVHVKFDSTMYADVVEAVEAFKTEASGRTTNADRVMTQFKNRGLLDVFLSTVDSVVALSGPVGHAGSALAHGGEYYTTCPAAVYSVMTGDGVAQSCDFEHDKGMINVGRLSDAHELNPPLMRAPENYESVVVVGRDADGVFLSTSTTVAQVARGGKTFMLHPTNGNVYSLVGGVVVSTSDSAVLGMYVRESSSMQLGRLSLCSTLSPRMDSAQETLSAAVKRIFPMLNPDSWDQDTLSVVFRHTSACNLGPEPREHNLGLAKIGDAVLRRALMINLRLSGRPMVTWEKFRNDLQSNANLAIVASSVGLASLVETQPGLSLPASSKAHADVLEALVAAVEQFELPATLDEFMSVLGVVPSVKELRVRDSGFGHLMRRPSELQVAGLEHEPGLSPVD